MCVCVVCVCVCVLCVCVCVVCVCVCVQASIDIQCTLYMYIIKFLLIYHQGKGGYVHEL